MNKETLAELINGRAYRNEMHKEEEQIAKESGLVIIFGASDDLVEFRGAIYDEIDAYNGTHFIIATPGTEIPVDENHETFRKAKQLEAITIEEESQTKKNRFEAVWSPDEPECSWLIKTDLPHSTFDIMEDGELYCRGLIIEVAALSCGTSNIDDDDCVYCKDCGEEMEWQECYSCGGEGGRGWEDLQFEDPLWYSPDDFIDCDVCEGKSGMWICPNKNCC